MLNNTFIKPLELPIAGEIVRFNSLSDFAFSLDGRAAVSSSKLTEIFKLTTPELESQLATIIETRTLLLSLLSRLSKQPESLSQSIRELD